MLSVLNVDIWFSMDFLHECQFFFQNIALEYYILITVFLSTPLNVVSEVVPPFAHPAVPFLLTVLL